MAGRLHLVDGTFELYRAHFARRPDHLAPDGSDRKASLGVAASLLSLLHDPDEQCTHVAVAFDNPIRSFRNDLFDAYKSDEGVPPVLREQFDVVERAVRALGIVVWSMDRWEADDALATGARKYRHEFDEIRILSPDKDLGQCLVDAPPPGSARVLQVDRIRRKHIDEKTLRATRGIGPASIPDFLALVGDTADGIPGLPGIGEKTAAALLDAYVHLEDIPDDASTWKVKVRGADGLAETLRARRGDALLYRNLATLVSDVPLGESAADLEWKGAPRALFDAFVAEIGGQSLTARVPRFRA